MTISEISDGGDNYVVVSGSRSGQVFYFSLDISSRDTGVQVINTTKTNTCATNNILLLKWPVDAPELTQCSYNNLQVLNEKT